MEVSMLGLDLAKQSFQVHGVDINGTVVVRRRLRRGQVEPYFGRLKPCVVGMEACATAHHWARVIAALGHEVRLIPTRRVKAYVQRGKNDALDAQAICEAASRPGERLVAAKSVEQQSVLMLHKSRDLLIRQRTMLINALRGHLAEFGLVAAKGGAGAAQLLGLLRRGDPALPALAQQALLLLAQQLESANTQILALDRAILAWHRSDDLSQRLADVPGIGPLSASALAVVLRQADHFSSARAFAAALGLTPKDHSTGGKTRLGSISKMGNGYLRRLLVLGATSQLRRIATATTPAAAWSRALLAKRPQRVVAVALANKTARIAWALVARQRSYDPLYRRA
jgi:transposase